MPYLPAKEILVRVECPSFVLPSNGYEDARSALRELAEESPAELDEPDALADATDLVSALEGRCLARAD